MIEQEDENFSGELRIFLKTHPPSSALGSHPYLNGVFDFRERSFLKTLSRVDLLENGASCRHVNE